MVVVGWWCLWVTQTPTLRWIRKPTWTLKVSMTLWNFLPLLLVWNQLSVKHASPEFQSRWRPRLVKKLQRSSSHDQVVTVKPKLQPRVRFLWVSHLQKIARMNLLWTRKRSCHLPKSPLSTQKHQSHLQLAMKTTKLRLRWSPLKIVQNPTFHKWSHSTNTKMRRQQQLFRLRRPNLAKLRKHERQSCRPGTLVRI